MTQFFAELIPDGPGEGFDDGKQGIVSTFEVDNPSVITRITLSPLADSGFTADRTNFCPQSAPTPPHSDIFCPDLDATSGSDAITKDPQGAFPNQLHAALIRDNYLYLPNIGAAPEPPVKFDVNVQALVHVVDITALSELANLHVNLNAQIKNEPAPEDPNSLGKLFGNDIVAIDANPNGTDFLIVSRGGNYVIRASLDADGKLSIGAPDNVVRFQVGNIPTGVVMSRNGRRAYVNNEVNASVSILNLVNNTVITRDVPSATVPEPGSFAHGVLVGKLVFFTALGELGFNVPSLLGAGYHAPYFHHGAAQTLEEVFAMHGFNGGTIESALSDLDRTYLIAFLKSIDGKTVRFRSEADDFRDPF